MALAEGQIHAAKAAVARTETNLRKAALDLERTRKLWKDGSTTREALDNGEAAARAAQADRAQAEALLEAAKLELSYARVSAPRDGIVSKLGAHEGQVAQPGQPVLEFVPLAIRPRRWPYGPGSR